MTPELIAALIAGLVSLTVAATTAIVQLILSRRQRQHELYVTEEQQAREAERIRSRYRDPLIAAANALQSRLFNIVEKKLFSQPAENEERRGRRPYSIESTLYVLAEFLGWVEILRQEMQFLDLGSDRKTWRLYNILHGVQDILAQNDPQLGSALRLFRVEQRAIGELMIESLTIGDQTRLSCIGPATFTQRLARTEFVVWLSPVEDSLQGLVQGNPGCLARAALLQNWLLELVDFLDPGEVRVPGSRRKLDILPEFVRFSPSSRKWGTEPANEAIANRRGFALPDKKTA